MTYEQFLLGKLAEEASEIAKIALKAQQFGLDEVRRGQDLSNKERIFGEIHDLEGIVDMLNASCNFGFERNQLARMAKVQKVDKYYHYSKSLGLVE